ncbi:MAG: MBL fold metallo-hydrolase [Rickettsiales endosymbiont of Dermacentor nuttalli]
MKNPGIDFQQLPPIDLILLNHDHYDHLDITTLHKLKEKFSPIIYAGLGIDNLLKECKTSANIPTLD